MARPQSRNVEGSRRQLLEHSLPNVDALSTRQATRSTGGGNPPAFPAATRSTVRTPDGTGSDGRIDYLALQASPAFADLRRQRRGFVLPATLAFFAWYLTYVLLAAYAPAFMAHPVYGRINIGLVFGMLQFLSTVLITTWYTRFARRTLDPRVDAIRHEVEAARSAGESA
jgi:uncharacterized membrane protein (DUF485 family)